MGNDCKLPTGVKKDDEIYVGYGPFWLNTIMIFISIFGIIINSIFVFNYLKSIINTKNQSNSGISAVEKMLCMIACVETFISVCWLLNNFFIHDPKNLLDRCILCSTIAHIEIFLYLFDWMVLSTSLYQIKIILLNPQQILESGKRVIKFVIFSFCFSLISFVFSIIAGFGGVSPMLTCFIRIEDLSGVQTAFFWIFFTIPIFCFSFGGYQIYLIMTSSQYKTEKKNRQLFREYSYFVITYIIFSIILISSYIFAKLKIMMDGLQAVFTLISCSNPLIVGIIRIFRTGLVKRLLKRKRKNIINEENENLIEEEKEEENPIYALEKKILENLIIKYFTAISFALGKSKYKEEEEENEVNLEKDGAPKFDENEHKEYKITKPEIIKDLDLAINEDIKILEESNFDINITEYNSSTFKKLRELEGLNEDLIISMFQPKKGTNQLINMVNETLYINSTNKLLMLKKVKREQLLFFQRNILGDLYQHLVNHPHSIICRVFGLYKIKIDQDAEENYMALMYNTNDSLENIDDIKFLKPRNMIRQMKINQEDISNYISIDTASNDSRLRTSNTIYSAVTLNSSIAPDGKIGGADTHKKSFILKIPGTEEQKLTEIITQDTEFLKKKGISTFSFLIFERNVEGKENSCLFKVEEDKENKIQIGQNVCPKIKKYIFNSTLENIMYSICILNYFRSKS